MASDIAVRVRGNVQLAFRHSVRATQLDSVEQYDGPFAARPEAPHRTVERAGHRAVRIRQDIVAPEVSNARLNSRATNTHKIAIIH